MQRRLKERLIGAAVLVMLAVIFIPMALDDSPQMDTIITETNIPERPVQEEFSSRIVPIKSTDKVTSETSREPEPLALRDQPSPVREEPVKSQPPVESKTVVTKKTVNRENVGVTAWVVQLGSFTNEANANALNKKLRKAGFTAFVEPLKQRTRMIYRVRVGPELLRSDAQLLQQKLKATMQIDGMVIQYP